MKGSKQTSFIVVAGILVLGVFVFVTGYNLLPMNRQSNSYYAKVGETGTAKITSAIIDGNTFTIMVDGAASEYCIKSTKTDPDSDNLCWKSIENSTASSKVYAYKQYYVWIKDTNDNISKRMVVGVKNES